MSESGTVLGVVESTLGSTLTADVTAGDTTVYLQDLAYFSPGGGSLTLTNGDTEEGPLSYVAIDEATGAVSGLEPPVNSFAQDDTIAQVSPVVRVRYAEVRIDGQQDSVRARVPFALFDRVADGFYADSAGEVLRVLVELQDEYVVTDILGVVPEVALENLQVLDDLSVTGNFRLLAGAQAYVESSVGIELQGQQGAPGGPPLLTQDWTTVPNFDPIASSSPDFYNALYSSRRGAYWDTVDNYILYVGGSFTGAPVRRVLPNGTGGTTLFSLPSTYQEGSIVRVGANYYVLALYLPTYEFKVRKYSTAGVYVSEWTWTGWRGKLGALMYEDGTDLWLAENNTSGVVRSQRWSTAGVLAETILTTGFTPNAAIVGCQGNRNFDFGAERHVFITEENLERIRHYDSVGAYSNVRVDAPGSAWTAGLLYDGTNFWVLGNGSTISGVTSSTLYKLENNYFTGSGSHWVSASWYDNNATGGTHETIPGPASKYALRRRKRWTWTVDQAIPFNGGSDEPNSVRIYLGQGATEPGTGGKWLQASGVTGEQSASIVAYVNSGTNPPTANDFPGSDPSSIFSGSNGTGSAPTVLGVGWALSGTGVGYGFSDIQTFTTASSTTWTKPMSGGCSTVEVLLIGAGGGGGSGRRNSAGSAAFGGGGGAGGSIARAVFPISSLLDGETISVGVGGAGGAGKTANADGNAGSDGGSSTMTIGGVSFLLATGGGGGAGGTAAAGGAGGIGIGGSSFGAGGLLGGVAGDGSSASDATNVDNVPRIIGSFARGGANGGGGGGGVNGAGTAGAGANGGTCYDLTGGVGGVTGTAPGAGVGKAALYGAPGSGGGGSGGRPGTASTRPGGAGGFYGGGGGGSGGGQTVDSGDGGAGADGIVVIICR